ncbi:MAG TPA: hypothetical protein PK400_09400 [Phycisphaerales bacterium]|nr:hypothetical protein [Phycisphaerales bacterium]HRQ76515.1 hypothetical protein [Phycisphaerales bacterium]
MTKNTIFIMTILVLMSQTASAATVQHFNNKDAWRAVVGEYDTIDFTGYPTGTQIVDQYSHQGVLFEGAPIVHSTGSYVNDNWGVHALGGMWLHFDQPIQWFAAEHPGSIRYQFFRDGTLLATSGNMGVGGSGNFSGVLLDEPFDTIYLFRSFPSENWVFVDDIHFGPPIPAPGALGVFALAAFSARSRRRRA